MIWALKQRISDVSFYVQIQRMFRCAQHSQSLSYTSTENKVRQNERLIVWMLCVLCSSVYSSERISAQTHQSHTVWYLIVLMLRRLSV